MSSRIKGHHLVVIDDDPAIGSALYQWFELGNKVLNFASAEQLLRSQDTLGAIDVFIIDYKLPGKDGLTLFKEMRTLHAQAKFILITGQMDYDLAEQSLNLGLDALILKPFDFNILDENISKLLAVTA